MKKLIASVVMAVVAVALGMSVANAAGRGNAEEAKALLTQAMEFYKAKGEAATFAEIQDPNGKLRDKDLYIFVQGFDGTTLAHGGNLKLVGKNMSDLKDPDGKLFIREFIEVAKTKGGGVVDYKWTNPETKKMEPKASYILRIEGKEMLMGCGYYK